jgi:hypothetical protein
MMYGANGYGIGYYAIWMHFHFLFAGLALFGLIAALLWLYKYADKKMLLNTVWITVIAGALGVLLTASMAFEGMQRMARGGYYSTGSSQKVTPNDAQEEGTIRMMDPQYWEEGQTEQNDTPSSSETSEQPSAQ